MEETLFVSARMKLDRARQFIRELEDEQDKYQDSDPLTLTVKKGEVEVQQASVSAWAGAVAGDAIHSLRTSLDQMASELARIAGRSDKDVYFPFASSQAEFDKAVAARRFDKAGADAVALLRQFAPYRGGNDALRAVHDLDIQDKHSTILAVDQRWLIEIQMDWGPLLKKEGPPVVSANYDPRDVLFAFGEGPLEGQRAVKVLKELVELVDGVIEAFAALVASRTNA